MSKYPITDIDIRSDGIYVLISYDSNNVKSDVLNAIQRYDVKDVNFNAVEDALSKRLDEVLISDNKEIVSRNERIDVNVSPDSMNASIVFHPPVNNGNRLERSDIIKELNAFGIRYGIKEELIDKAIAEKVYGCTYEVAFGDEPKKGIDGAIQCFFTTDKKSLKPKELADGSVDYHNLDLFEVAREGQILAKVTESVPGKDGINIYGKICPVEKSKKTPMLPKGKNTKIGDDKITLVSEISGRIFYMDGRVSVLPILEIPGNVDNATGNIDFIGTVIIKGNIVSGFSVTAGADIEVEGSVEGAAIKAKGNILLMKGVQGGNKAVITAGGDINANFIESSVICASGSITANSIMHSTVKCGGSLTLIGKRGLFVGGKAIVGERISAKIIGSSMATLTELEVGVDPLKLEEYRNAVKDIEKYTDDYKKTEKIIEILSKVNIKDLSDDKKKILMDSIRSKIVIKSKINEAQFKVDSIMPMFSKQSGRVEASGVIYSGVKVMINNAIMYVRDDLSFCSLYNKDGKITIGSHS